MSYTGERHSIPAHQINHLYVVECGLTRCDRGHYTPPQAYVYYGAHFILQGSGQFMMNGQTYPLRSGQGFMIFPDVLCSYAADENTPWEYIYVCFACDRQLIHHAGLDEDHPIYSFELTDQFLQTLFALLNTGNSQESRGYDSSGYLLLVMNHLVVAHSKKSILNDEHRFYPVVTYVENHYAERISIDDIATENHMNRATLYRLCKKHLNATPSQFLLSFRLSRSEMLLRSSALSISQIAYACGFCDPTHFSRAFSAKFGQSPNQFRKHIGKS